MNSSVFFKDKNEKSTACNKKFSKAKLKKERTICKNCYNKKKRKNNNNTFIQNHKKNINNVNTNKNNRTVIIGFSNCGKNYLMNYILFHLREPIFMITKSLSQYPNIKAQTSDENQTIEIYGNNTVVFDDMLLTKQKSSFDLFFTRGRHQNIDIYYISQTCFHLPKNTILKNLTTNVLNKESLRTAILLIHDITGLEMNLEEWKKLCFKAWKKDYEYSQIGRFAKTGEGRNTIGNCNKMRCTECTFESIPLQLT